MEDDEQALKEDEGLPRGTLGTEVCPRTPSNLHSQAEFLGPRALHPHTSPSLRGVASGLSRPLSG